MIESDKVINVIAMEGYDIGYECVITDDYTTIPEEPTKFLPHYQPVDHTA